MHLRFTLFLLPFCSFPLPQVLQEGNEQLKAMQKLVSVADVEKLMEDTAEAQEYMVCGCACVLYVDRPTAVGAGGTCILMVQVGL